MHTFEKMAMVLELNLRALQFYQPIYYPPRYSMLGKMHTFEQVTMVLELNLRCSTASQWCTRVFSICPLLTSHTLQEKKSQ